MCFSQERNHVRLRELAFGHFHGSKAVAPLMGPKKPHASASIGGQ